MVGRWLVGDWSSVRGSTLSSCVDRLQEAREWREDVQGCVVRADEIVMSEEACDATPPQGAGPLTRTLLNGVLNGVSGTGHVLGVLLDYRYACLCVVIFFACFAVLLLLPSSHAVSSHPRRPRRIDAAYKTFGGSEPAERSVLDSPENAWAETV